MKKIICAVVAAACVLLCGCGLRESYRTFFAMDTVMTLRASGSGSEQALERAEQLVLEYEALFSVTDEDSDISKINRSSGEYVSVDPRTAALVSRAVSFGELTGGNFDITVYPLVAEWDIMSDSPRVPQDSDISALLPLVDYAAVSVDGERVMIPKGSAIDLGGLAKGYAASEAAKLLRELGISRAVISLGGNVETVGEKSAGRAWHTAIQDPQDTDDYIGYLEASDLAVVTSGAYRRYFELDGRIYHHIIDPRTGYPSDSDLLSATVVCADGAYADALSTAVFIMGERAALELCSERGDFDLILVTRDDRVVVTAGIFDLFHPVDDSARELEKAD